MQNRAGGTWIVPPVHLNLQGDIVGKLDPDVAEGIGCFLIGLAIAVIITSLAFARWLLK